MKQIRIRLLGLLVVLITLASRGPAAAATLQGCINICNNAYTLCKLNCNGNATCDNNCYSQYTLCLEGCNKRG